MKISKLAIENSKGNLRKYVLYVEGSNLFASFNSIKGVKDFIENENVDGVLTGFNFNEIIAISKDGKFLRSGKKFEQLKSEIKLIEKFDFKPHSAVTEVGNFPLDSFEDYKQDGVTWKVYSKNHFTKKQLLVRIRNGAYDYTHTNETTEKEIKYEVEKKLLINVDGNIHKAIHWYTRFDEISEEFKTWVLAKIDGTTKPYFVEQKNIVGWEKA